MQRAGPRNGPGPFAFPGLTFFDLGSACSRSGPPALMLGGGREWLMRGSRCAARA